MSKTLVAFFAVMLFTGCGVSMAASSEEVSAAPEAMAAQLPGESAAEEAYEVEASPEAYPAQEAAPE